ncbi:tRNA pseudouridine(38-40) synthase TruA [Cyclobacterium marinum]|uniref:tRNA pseudouridine(38-40) synthase TruA n=1 Tax=Cyclobacterium marinum TaxID=104 RepID=UPI0011EF3ADF|nr:tRNA pseudouridine(38-40) synthase TruA [Cyclobacterium marinum]MBI0401846.1 tRNA pseudouridine(38-40) synthase TruA [Cyclobacterium marinum]
MQTKPFKYLFRIQYLGLRYHGWQVQKGVKTIQGTLEKTFRYVLQHENFKILGSSRTDTGVSCLNGAFELFLPYIIDPNSLIGPLNDFLPADIRILEGFQSSYDFNVIQDVANKSYGYHFSFGPKPHPMYAGSVAYAGQSLDLGLMNEGAALFKGKHDFRRFCSQGKNTHDFIREITYAQIDEPSEHFTFLPEKNVKVFRVKGSGFLMHQVRRMAACLISLGKGELKLGEIEEALTSSDKTPLSPKAPANGLILEKVSFVGDKFE